MANKSLKKSKSKPDQNQNEKRLRIIFRLLMIAVVMIIIAYISSASKLFINTLYATFISDSITMSFLIIAFLTLCSLLLYGFFIIIVFNPDRLKKSPYIKFVFGGIFTLTITALLAYFGITEITKMILDVEDHSAGESRVQDLLVTGVTRGRVLLIDTVEGEMYLSWEDFRIHEGQTYRFTYLDATNTIIEVEQLID